MLMLATPVFGQVGPGGGGGSGGGCPLTGCTFNGPVSLNVTVAAKTAHDEIISTSGVVSASANTLTDANASFTQSLLGKVIILDGLGVAGADLQATVASVQDATHLTFSGPTATYPAPWYGIGRAYVVATSPVTASYAIGDTVTASGGTSQTTAGAFQVVSLGVASPAVVSGGTSGANGACTFVGTTGVTRVNWATNPNGQNQVAGNGYFEASGTVSGGALTGPLTVVVPGDYITPPYAFNGSSSPAPTVTFTNSSAVIGATAHGLVAGTPVQLSTTGGLPTNFAVATTYYVSSTGLTANAFEVSATAPTVVYNPATGTITTTTNGTPIVAGSAGSGTQTATVVEPVAPVSGTCTGLVNAAVQVFMAPHYVMQTTAGIYTTLPSNPVSTTTSGSGAGAQLTLWGQNIAGNAAPGDQVGGLYAIGTDDTTPINAAITTAFAAGGGEVVFPPGRSLMLGAWQIPYTGTAPPTQPPLMLSGAGQMAPQTKAGFYFSMYSQGVTGSIIDNRFSGDGGTHVAKMDTRGMGSIQTERISFTDFGTDNFLMFQTTNTQPFLEHTTFLGNPSCYLMSCQQNIIRLGGITSASNTLSTNAATAGFQSNVAVIRDAWFGHVQEAIQFGGAANSAKIDSIQVDRTSGSWTTAPIHLYGAGGFGSGSNTFYGGEMEMQGFPYGVYMDSHGGGNNQNSFNGGPVMFDGAGLTPANAGVPTVGGFYFGTTSRYNGIFNVTIENDIKTQFLNGADVLFNTMVTGAQGTPSVFANPMAANGGLSVNAAGAVSGELLLGPGAGAHTMTINGGNTNSSDGAKLQFSNAGTACNIIGNKSAVLGGTYSADMVVNSNCSGVGRIDAFNTDQMTWDFTNGLAVLVGTRYTSNVTTTPSTGGTVTFAAKQRSAIITPAGTLATLTLQLPNCTNSLDGYEVLFKSSQIVSALTVTTSGGSVVGPPTAVAPGTTYTFHCQGSNTTWY